MEVEDVEYRDILVTGTGRAGSDPSLRCRGYLPHVQRATSYRVPTSEHAREALERDRPQAPQACPRSPKRTGAAQGPQDAHGAHCRCRVRLLLTNSDMSCVDPPPLAKKVAHARGSAVVYDRLGFV